MKGLVSLLILATVFLSCRKDEFSQYEGGEFAIHFIGTWQCKGVKVWQWNKLAGTVQETYSSYPESGTGSIYGEITQDFYYHSHKSDSLVRSSRLPIQSFSRSGDKYIMYLGDEHYVTVKNDTLRACHWVDLRSNKDPYLKHYTTFVRKQ